MPWLHIVILFVGNQIAHHTLVFLGHTALYKLVQNRIQLLLGEGTTFQQNFQHGKYFLITQHLPDGWLQAVALHLTVVDQILHIAGFFALVVQKGTDILYVP